MQTMPMPLEALRAQPGALDEFRVSGPREIAALLRQLCDGSVALHLIGGDGGAVPATVWAIDAERGHLGFAVDAADPALQALLACTELVVVGYLDHVKLQFDAAHAVLVRSPRASVLNCAYPRELFRFQRRNAYRVRPLLRDAAMARLQHSEIAELALALRIVDLSISGCALFLPEDVPAMQVGTLLRRVQLDLDAGTGVLVDLKLQHVTLLTAQARGVRLGCEFVRPDALAERTLQRFIDATQKRAKLTPGG